jgi:hypothetical protein
MTAKTSKGRDDSNSNRRSPIGMTSKEAKAKEQGQKKTIFEALEVFGQVLIEL